MRSPLEKARRKKLPRLKVIRKIPKRKEDKWISSEELLDTKLKGDPYKFKDMYGPHRKGPLK